MILLVFLLSEKVQLLHSIYQTPSNSQFKFNNLCRVIDQKLCYLQEANRNPNMYSLVSSGFDQHLFHGSPCAPTGYYFFRRQDTRSCSSQINISYTLVIVFQDLLIHRDSNSINHQGWKF